MQSISINAIIYVVGTILLGVVGFFIMRLFSNYDARLDAHDKQIEKLDHDAFAKIERIKTEMKKDLESTTDKLFEIQGHENEKVVDMINDLNRKREENRMCIKEMRGEMNTLKVICERNHEKD
ncbi:MAG: hypothetical protein WC374_13080 [Phycisphaerae bacterium]|jgi:hypothetical protein